VLRIFFLPLGLLMILEDSLVLPSDSLETSIAFEALSRFLVTGPSRRILVVRSVRPFHARVFPRLMSVAVVFFICPRPLPLIFALCRPFLSRSGVMMLFCLVKFRMLSPFPVSLSIAPAQLSSCLFTRPSRASCLKKWRSNDCFLPRPLLVLLSRFLQLTRFCVQLKSFPPPPSAQVHLYEFPVTTSRAPDSERVKRLSWCLHFLFSTPRLLKLTTNAR